LKKYGVGLPDFVTKVPKRSTPFAMQNEMKSVR
jgi:hypothetical protein